MMIKTPSIKTLMERLHVSKKDAEKIKDSMQNKTVMQTLNLANAFMSGYGVESLYPEYVDFYYVNMGETYANTLCFTGKNYIVSSWGDYVEKHDPEIM